MIALYPGSFDPVTRGHLDVIARAAAFCPHLVIGVGRNMHKKSLFSDTERVSFLRQAIDQLLPAAIHDTISIQAYDGATMAFAESVGATLIIKGLRGAADYAYEEKMAIVNQRLAPHIDTVFLFTNNALRDVSSSVVKEMALAGVPATAFDHYLTPVVRDALLARLKPAQTSI